MIRLADSARTFGTPDFVATLQREIAALPFGSLPIAGEQGGLIDPHGIGVTLLSAAAGASRIQVVIGVFFREIVGGCSCGDDPFGVESYLELCLQIERADGAARFVERETAPEVRNPGHDAPDPG